MLKFDNPPIHVTKVAPKHENPPPILHSFDITTGNYIRGGNPFLGMLVFQPIQYQLKYSARNGDFKKEWLDVLFLSRFNKLGLLSISDWHALDLFESLQILKIRSIQTYGVWLCMSKRINEVTANRGSGRTYLPIVDSFYWSSEWDVVNAERVLYDLKTKSWSQER